MMSCHAYVAPTDELDSKSTSEVTIVLEYAILDGQECTVSVLSMLSVKQGI